MNLLANWMTQSPQSYHAHWQAKNLPRERGAIARRILAAHPMLDCYHPGDAADVIVEAARASGVSGATVDLVPSGVPLAVAIDFMCDRVCREIGISL